MDASEETRESRPERILRGMERMDGACEAVRGSPETPLSEPGADKKEAVRRHIIERFSSWLDDVLAAEEPPRGIAAEILAEIEGAVDLEEAGALEGPCDVHSVWSALTAVCQEVKLQGRAFKDLSEKTEPFQELASRVDTLIEAQRKILSAVSRAAEEARARSQAQSAELVAEAERRARREILELVLDIRDRLARGLQGAEARAVPRSPVRSSGWLSRLLGRTEAREAPGAEAVAAIEKGYTLTLDRIEEALDRLGVREIDCRDRLFDPHLMSAVDVEKTSAVREGTILQVFRAGYVWNGETLRTAKVRVARAPEEA